MYPIFAASDTGPLCSAYTDSLPSTEKATAFIDIVPPSTPAIAPTGNLHPDSIDEDSALSASASARASAFSILVSIDIVSLSSARATIASAPCPGDGRKSESASDLYFTSKSSLVLACVPKREDVNDVIVSSDGAKLSEIKSGGIIGTSSLRRAVQVSRKRPDLVVKPVRGNIDTRIKKIGDQYDAIILAQAGISRLDLDVKYKSLALSDFLPSPGQGALAIVARAEDKETISMLTKIENADARAEALAERALSSSIESGCRFPVGAIAGVDGGTISINAVAFSVDGKESVYAEQSGPVSEAAKIGYMAGKELKDGGIEKLALNWREKLAEWNKNG